MRHDLVAGPPVVLEYLLGLPANARDGLITHKVTWRRATVKLTLCVRLLNLKAMLRIDEVGAASFDDLGYYHGPCLLFVFRRTSAALQLAKHLLDLTVSQPFA